MLPHQERPSLRPGLAADLDSSPESVLLWDRYRLVRQALRLSYVELDIVRRFDGSLTLEDLHQRLHHEFNGQTIPFADLAGLVEKLDEAHFLAGPRFAALLNTPVRAPSCIGCYSGDPHELRNQLKSLFTHPRGAGLPDKPATDNRLTAALLPHIDYARGGLTYTWGFRELFEQTTASLFVIIATSHYSRQRFTLTRQNFQTPLGTVPTDQHFVDELVANYGEGLFDDPVAHLPEHSIELEVVFLQYLFENRRPIRIVPLLVGSFQDCVGRQTDPAEQDNIDRMVSTLRLLERESAEPICYLISGDLAHLGAKFGDRRSLSQDWLAHSRAQDERLLQAAAAGDWAGYYQVIAEERDARRICGFPPTYTTLAVARPASGRVLHYDQFVAANGSESVSFASMAFYH